MAARVRQNYWAILVAAVASFVFEAAWFTIFMKQWLAGIGRTVDALAAIGKAAGMNEWEQYSIAFACTLLCATDISCVTQLTGPQSAARGIKVAALLWLAFVFTAQATNDIFELRPFNLFLIYAGAGLLEMVLMGAIVGGWKAKAAASQEMQARKSEAVAG